MTWRAAHGASAAGGRLVASEALPLEEMPAASPPDTARPDRTPDGRFAPGNRTASAKRLRAGPRGELAKLAAKGDAAARAAHAWGQRYSAHRRAELTALYGEVSAGVGGLVESAAGFMSRSRYWAARAIAEGNPEHDRLAAYLQAQARGCERDALEMAGREAQARKHQSATATPPWMRSTP